MGTTKLLAFVALAQLMAATFAYAAIPITLVADTSTPDPSGGNFTNFGLPSSDRDYETVYDGAVYNNVFFTAQGSNGSTGVYGVVFPGPGINEIYTIADTTMTAATGANFASFSNTTSGENEAGFIAKDTNGNQSIYDYDGYGLHFIASSSTSPVSGTTFGNFQSISFMSNGPGNDTGEGEIESTNGIYDFISSFAPAFTLVANTSTIAPGASSPYTSFGPVSFKASQTASNTPGYFSPAHAMLATVNNVVGVYAIFGGNFHLASVGGSIPGGGGTFTGFGNPVSTDTYIEFTASYSNTSGPQQGIFLYGPYLHFNEPGGLMELLASGTVAPGSNGAHFLSFQSIGDNQAQGNFENENIPFIATLDDGQSGLFCTTGIGTSVKIIDTGDSLDDRIVSSIQMSPESAGQVFTVFEVGFTDGSSGIYYFDTNVLPEPAATGLLALPALLMLRRRR